MAGTGEPFCKARAHTGVLGTGCSIAGENSNSNGQSLRKLSRQTRRQRQTSGQRQAHRQAVTGRQAGRHRQASSQTSRQTYWQGGGNLAGRDRHRGRQTQAGKQLNTESHTHT